MLAKKFRALLNLPKLATGYREYARTGLQINACACCNRDGNKRTKAKEKNAKRRTLRTHRKG